MNLKKAVEPTTSSYCTDCPRDFDDLLLHRMDDTPSVTNHQNLLGNQHINHSRDDSTAFFRLKNFVKIIYTSFLIFFLTSCSSNNSATVTKINDPELLNIAQSLPAHGTLKTNHKGFVYLKVSDDYIKALYPILLKHVNSKEAPCIHPAKNSHGAHVSLFYHFNPYKLHSLPIGKVFNFHVQEIQKVVLKKHWHQYTEKRIWYVLLINSPSLSTHVKYLAPAKFYKKTLHISIAREDFSPDGICIH